MTTITPVTSGEDLAATLALLREYTAWATTLTERLGTAPTFEGLEEELAGLPGVYAPPLGRLLLARQAGQPAGCVALKPADAGAGELKRLYVRPAFRGYSIGAQLVAAVVAAARQAGYQRLRLDSHQSMTHAHALYRAAGFQQVNPPPGFPEAIRPVVVFMELALA